jgi:photosystem II stability/assembly factor-like uncharacterized protein
VPRVSIHIATLGFVLLWAGAASTHMPHDVVTTVAVAEDAADTRLVMQYEFRRRPMMVISEDGGSTWFFRAPAMSRETLTDLRFADASTLYAADGLAAEAAVSRDGGLTWASTAAPDSSAVSRVAPSPGYAEAPILFAATETDVSRSDDGGETWLSLDAHPPSLVRDLALSPSYPDDPFVAALTQEHGLLVSEDDGASWDLVPIGAHQGIALSLSPTFGDDGQLWISATGGVVLYSEDRGRSFATRAIQLDGAPLEGDLHDLQALPSDRVLGLTGQDAALCSSDDGDTWDLCDTGIPEASPHQQGSWGHYRWLDGRGSIAALAAWEGLVLSKDGGRTWDESCFLLPHYTRTIAFSPQYPDDPSLWIGSYGSGLVVTHDGGETWSVQGEGQHAQHVQAVALSPTYSDDPVVFAVADRALWRSVDGGIEFEAVDLGEIESLHRVVFSLDFDEYGIAYALGASSDDSIWYGARTVDGGNTWLTVWSGEEADAPKVTQVLRSADPDSHAIYATQTEPSAVLASDSFGDRWEVLRDFSNEGDLAALFALPGDRDDRLVVVTADGSVWEGAPIEGDWRVVADLGARVVTGASGGGANPDFDGAALYVALDPPGLARSLDGGVTWSELDSPFQTTVNTMAFPRLHPDDPTLVVGTHFGTFATCDEGETWNLLDRLMRLEDGSCPLRYSGEGWQTVHGEGTGGTATVSGTPGDSVEVEFWGRLARVLIAEADEAGRAHVFADGEPLGEMRFARTGGCSPSAALEHEFDTNGLHTIRIEVVGDGTVAIDAFEIERTGVRNGPDTQFEADTRCLSRGDGCSGSSCSFHDRRGPSLFLIAGLVVSLAVRRLGSVTVRRTKAYGS